MRHQVSSRIRTNLTTKFSRWMKWRFYPTGGKDRRPWPAGEIPGIQAGAGPMLSSQRVGSLDCCADCRENAGQDMNARKTTTAWRPSSRGGCTPMNACRNQNKPSPRGAVLRPCGFPMPFALEALATRRRPSSACARGRRTSPTSAVFFQTSNIHILTCDAGQVTLTLAATPARRQPRPRQVHLATGRHGLRGRRPDQRRDRRLCLQRLSRPLRLLPAVWRHHHRPPDQRNAFDIRATSRLEPAVRRTAEGQP